MTTPTITVYVRGDNTATLTCPACNALKQVPVEQFRHGRHTMTVRCHCQTTFTVLLDFRQQYRKQTSLHGTYEIQLEQGPISGLLQVTNLSQTGISFAVSGTHRIKEGQKILLEFHLDDKKRTLLKKKATVTRVQENTIACEFRCDTDMDRHLGFYLRS